MYILSSGPALTRARVAQRNNKLVWDETVLIMQDLFDNVWGGKDEIAVSQVVDEVTLPVRRSYRSPWCP